MAQGDYLIQNQSFPSFRSDLNDTLEAINTSNSGTSRPSSAVAGTVWLDTTSATTPTLKFYDGTDDISLATLDYTANTVNWLDSVAASSDVVDDTTPQLGGDLDVNGNDIVSVSDGNITFTPDGAGKVVISGLSFPTSDGSADQVLKTDGSGNLSFTDLSGGIEWQSSIVTASTITVVAGRGYWINTTSNACTITLPASASVGDELIFTDYLRTWGTNALTINQNSLNFQGYTTPNPVYNTNGQSVNLVYSGATQGWIPTVDDDVTNETPQSYSADFLVIAGGGGGGSRIGGAGGAGGYRSSNATYGSSGGGGSAESSLTLNEGTVYTITVGAGGAGVAGGSPTVGTVGTNGSNSLISGTGLTTITSIGGGSAGVWTGTVGVSGGSGGGGSASTGTVKAGGSGTVNQGYAGGSGQVAPNYGTGGGGGAGAVGVDGSSNNAGNGGVGTASTITGSSVTRGGGGGGTTDTAGTAGTGGTGGGGNGGTVNTTNAGGNGTVNTGGGGGAGGNDGGGSGVGGTGGSGVVILRMLTTSYSSTTTGSPTVSTSGSDTILIYNASGSYTA